MSFISGYVRIRISLLKPYPYTDIGMESETNENNNNVHKVDIHQQNETNLNKSNDKPDKISLQKKSSLSNDDQDIVTPPAQHSQDVVPSKSGPDKGHNDIHEHQNKDHAEHRKDNEPHVQEDKAGNSDGKLRSTDRSTYEPSDNDSELEGEYSFTEDQKRAMMELMVQKHEDGDIIDEDPPEYNVKGRLIILNAELANDPIPIEGNRETKVGFKPEIVDLVAPPPSYNSDDESQPDTGRNEKRKPGDIDEISSPGRDAPQKKPEHKEGTKKPNNESYVVERDGNFSVLTAKELTPSEYELYVSKDKKGKSSNEGSGDDRKLSNDRTVAHGPGQATVAPRPPSKPRPTTAVSGPRRATGQSARPKSAAPTPQHESSLHNFDYNSPYALTKDQKDEARREAKKLEEERREQERKKKEEEEEKQKESMSVFEAWLKKKKEEEKNKKQESEQDDDQRKEERENAYKTWVKEKKAQGKREKLLRRREQQERSGNYVIRTQEDCDKAFKEWLKKKKMEWKKQEALEKQRCRLYKLYQLRAKRTLALLKALNYQSRSPYLDYYGYLV